jgi:hypothetical protein
MRSLSPVPRVADDMLCSCPCPVFFVVSSVGQAPSYIAFDSILSFWVYLAVTPFATNHPVLENCRYRVAKKCNVFGEIELSHLDSEATLEF